MRVSVIIVSRHRPALLRRCLIGLGQQDHEPLEVIVVADPAGLAATDGFTIKRVLFDQPNISAARNLGLAQASGDVVAFIDDDAVPEPTWARRLTAHFADAGVVAATGFVRGRNGISFQWQASLVDDTGTDSPLPVDGVTLLPSTPQRAVKTQGTNCAFRRDALLRVGGFDPAFRFFLDETDLNLRMAGQGLTAVIPDAQVHHGFAAGPHRRADRVPKSLFDIAASTAVFLRRHTTGGGPTAAQRDGLVQRERRRALGHMIAGRIEPRDVARLLASLDAGWQDGMARDITPPQPMAPTIAAFLPLPGTGPRGGVMLSGWRHQSDALFHAARRAVGAGRIVTVILFTPDARPHHMGFTQDGFWLQTGGIFGPSQRSEAVFRLWRRAGRLDHEIRRLSGLRPVE